MDLFAMTLNPNKREPLYQQLYSYIVTEIQHGNLCCGEKLPSKRALCSYLKISQNTVETAYSMLVAEGYVRSVPKSGFYVCELDSLVSFPLNHSPYITVEKKNPPPYHFDLKTNLVDTSLFPYSTWAKISKEVLYNNPNLLNHGDGQGDLCLREALCKYLHESRGVNCSPNQIIIGAGIEYLTGLTVQLLTANTLFALENPGYSGTRRILSNSGRDICFIPLDRSGMILDALEESGANVAYLTPSHQFPMGIIMPVGRRSQLLSWAAKHESRYLIEDDYDSEFRFNGRPIPSMQGMDIHKKVIYIGTFSRSLAPSIRIAYLVLPHTLLEQYHQNFGFYSSTVSRFEQHTLTQFITSGHFGRHINRMRNLYRRRAELFLNALECEKIPFKLLGEKAGLHLLVQINNGMSEQELVQKAQASGVRIYGLSSYAMPPAEIPESTIVMGYAGLKEEEIPEVSALLYSAWK